MAQASVVLLKNTGVLPLAANTKKVAVIGPNADEIMTLVGNYYGTPSKPVTLVQGIRNALPAGDVVYARGVDLVENRQDPRAVPPIPSQYLAAGRRLDRAGAEGRVLQGQGAAGRADRHARRPLGQLPLGSPEPDHRAGAAGPDAPASRRSATTSSRSRWTGQLVPPVTGRYEMTVTGDDGFRLDVAGQRVLDEWTPTPRARARSAMLDFEAGKAYDVKLEYFENIRDAEVRLNWKQPGAKDPYQEALDAAKAADVVIFAGGLNGEVEGEEMPVIYPGFAGGDRTEIALPKTQQTLLEDLHKTGQAGRARADDRLGAGRRVGQGQPAGRAGRLVSRSAGRQRHRRRAVRQGQSVRPPAGDVLQVGRPTCRRSPTIR